MVEGKDLLRLLAAKRSPLHVLAVEFGEVPPSVTCEETCGVIGDQYLCCGKPAVMLIHHRGRAEGPYFMCLEHGVHNCANRDAALIASKITT